MNVSSKDLSTNNKITEKVREKTIGISNHRRLLSYKEEDLACAVNVNMIGFDEISVNF